MSGSKMKLFCKDCKRECIKLRSNSQDNPGRYYFSCPLPRIDGGHGWMEWVDGQASPSTKHKSLKEELLDLLAIRESKLQSVEADLKTEREIAHYFEEELAAEKKKLECSMKCLAGILLFVVVSVMIVMFS